MALLTPKALTIPGARADNLLDAVSASDTVAPVANAWYEVNNASGGNITVTVVVPGTAFGQNNADVAHTVPTGQRWRIALPTSLVDPATGLITITHSGTTSVTGAVFFS